MIFAGWGGEQGEEGDAKKISKSSHRFAKNTKAGGGGINT